LFLEWTKLRDYSVPQLRTTLIFTPHETLPISIQDLQNCERTYADDLKARALNAKARGLTTVELD
jgi:hypothetical protein